MAMLPRVFRSVRVRLLVIALLPMLVLLPVMLGSTMLRWSGKIDDILIAKVHGDLTIADQYLGPAFGELRRTARCARPVGGAP